MRRALILALLAAPAFVAAQSATPAVGVIERLPTTMNIAQCAGTTEDPNRIPPVEDADVLSITWQVKLDASMNGVFTPTTGLFKVYASRTQFQASNQDDPWSCRRDIDGDTLSPLPPQIGNDDGYIAPEPTRDVPVTIDFASIASDLTLGCSGARTEIHLCVEWLPTTTSDPKGWATGSIEFDPEVPGAPSDVRLSPGDGRIRITGCTEGTDGENVIARATAPGTRDRWSSEVASCGNLVITGLTNGTRYAVTVYSLSSAHNPGPASIPVEETPIPTDDFWEEYQEQGGAEQGGCNTAAGAAGLLAALSLLAALAVARRRKP